ncbi:MAG: PD-(D/E)XK nuclease family protein, partial [Treponema sp.]|nr:PD-(D/E)XK nuclease family protein [Treponema sp.]
MNPVEAALLAHIDNPASLFIFPTDVAASRWADHVLRLRGGGTVAMEQFIAWDTFKQRSIHSKVQGKQSIPSALRKMFVSALIRENARLCKQGEAPIFTSLIRPGWAQQAVAFTTWLTEILPQLAVWYRHATGLPITAIGTQPGLQRAENFANDDHDLFNMAFHYWQFLEKHGLFEPAWESPPFENMGNECFIFFSECLFDFNEYRELLTASDHVTIIEADLSEAEQQSRDVFFYTNSRSEITGAALYILALHDNQKIPWYSISVSIPESGNYGPYLQREFENRNIPYIKRSGKPLASYPAGQFFRALADCAAADFSFSSLTALLLNRYLPWKDGKEIQNLIEFGIKNNCIHSWTEEEDGKEIKINVWDDAFSHPFGGYAKETSSF